MENGNDTFHFPENSFWSKYKELKRKITAFKRTATSQDLYDLHPICVEVEENVLEHEEDPDLSLLQNKIRKLNSGTELCQEICLLQRNLSYLELKRVATSVLEGDRYSKIAGRITSRKQLALKREQFFYKQALINIKESLDESEQEMGGPESQTSTNPDDQWAENCGVLENISPRSIERARDDQASVIPSPFQLEIARVVVPEDENVRISKVNTTDDADTDVPNAHCTIALPDADDRPETAEETNGGLLEPPSLLRITQVHHVPEPSILGDTGITSQEHNNKEESNCLDELPSLGPTPQKKKRYLPVFDNTTTISNYSARARRLNREVLVQRVQVFRGPPTLIQAFTLNHVLKTPAMNNGISGTVRSSVLERLYSRHQITDKKPHVEVENNFVLRRSAVQKRMQVTEENFQERQGEPSELHGSELLTEMTEKRMQQSVPNTVSNVHTSKEAGIERESEIEAQLKRLYGTPMSRLLQREIAPRNIGASDPWLPPRSPRVQNLQRKKIEEPIAEPWFIALRQTPPREQWREFKFVRGRLTEIWNSKMEKNMPMKASIREVLNTGEDWRKENALTLLRVLDKMSLRREIVLSVTDGAVDIYPFCTPYVTSKQYELRDFNKKYT